MLTVPGKMPEGTLLFYQTAEKGTPFEGREGGLF